MTVAATPRRAGPFLGNGVTTSFPFTFKVFAPEDVQVTFADANGIETVLASGYTVTPNADQNANPGGVVIYPSSGTALLAAGQSLTLTGALEVKQQTDLTNLGRFLPSAIENAQDYNTILIQQLQEKMGRMLVVPVSDAGVPAALPAAAQRAGKFFAFDGAGNPIAASGTGADSGLRTDLAASGGSSLVAFLASGTGAVSRSLQAKARDVVSVKDFGAVGDGVTDDTAAINLAIASGAKRIHFPAGTYNTTGSHSLNGKNGLQLVGAGVGAAILNITSATNHLFTTGSTVTNNLLIEGFTITSTSVVRTAGWVFVVADAYNSTGALSNSVIRNLQITKQVNGLWISKYQFVNVENVLMYGWVGSNGVGLQFGQTTGANINQGSEAHCRGVQIYGNDLAGGAPVLSSGLWIEDTDAVYLVDCGIGGVLNNDLVIKANVGGHSPSNHFFTGSVFDATKSSDCIAFAGGGTVQHLMFANCWIAAAGQLTGGSAEACGINFNSSVQYSHVTIAGGTIKECKGSGVRINPALAGAFTITGVDINTNGAGAGTNRHGINVIPTAAVSLGLQITGCNLSSNTPADLNFNVNARDYNVVGNYISTGVTSLGSFCRFEGNYDKASNTIASATTITVPPTRRFFNITGTTNIAGITATHADHIIQLKFAGSLTVLTASQNLQLASNFTAAAGSVLTLMCDGATWYEIGRKT